MKYSTRKASCVITGNALVIVECHNGLIFAGSDYWMALDNMMAYYGL